MTLRRYNESCQTGSEKGVDGDGTAAIKYTAAGQTRSNKRKFLCVRVKRERILRDEGGWKRERGLSPRSPPPLSLYLFSLFHVPHGHVSTCRCFVHVSNGLTSRRPNQPSLSLSLTLSSKYNECLRLSGRK